ncbi:ATP-binding cassette domain-containing protein [Photobacterium nomapromontoriensis]|uniref:ATP-binding cassette domain-containing protein n=1 Tax=Photobacterium nomapromontoriensis TaxID=2910237 RepID=UPI003D13D98A
MLSLHNAQVRYHDKPLNVMDIELTRGEIVGLTGPSGCGKSSLAKVLAGIQPLSAGKRCAPPRIKGEANPVQWVTQQPEFAFNPYLSLQRSLRESWQSDDFMLLLADYGICPSWLQRKPEQLSGGQLQRLNLVRALVPSTQFLLCDEISAPLDLLTQKQLWQTLLNHCRTRQLGVLIISHDRALLNRLCDRQVCISSVGDNTD